MSDRGPRLRAIAALCVVAFCAIAVSPMPRRFAFDLSALAAALAAALAPFVSNGGLLVIAIALGAGLALFLGTFLAAILDKGARESALRRRRMSLLRRSLLAVAVLSLFLALAPRIAGGAGGGSGPRASPPESGLSSSGSGPGYAGSNNAAADFSAPRSPTLWLWLAGLAGALGLTGLAAALGILHLAPRPVDSGGGGKGGDDDETLRLRASRRRLELGDDVRDSILRCYEEMCGIFAPQAASAPHGEAMLTAREFAALLDRRGMGGREVTELTSIFEKARYSIEPCTEADRVAALESIRALERARGGAAHGQLV